MQELIQLLKEKQKEREENQREFAEFLGISQSALSRLYRNKRNMGGQVLAKILTRYPDVASFFVSDYVNEN